jgi:hypothetical protein
LYFVQLDTARTLYADLPIRCSSGVTFVVKNPAGGTVQTSTAATRNSVDTITSGVTAVGATTLSVSSGTGIWPGKKYALGATGSGNAANESLKGEVVTVKSITSTTVTLLRPTQRAHASGASFQSREISMAVASTTPTAIGRHWRIEVTWTSDDGYDAVFTEPRFIIPFDVVRFEPVTSATEDDMFDFDPIAGKRLPAGFFWPALRDRAWEMILRRVAAKVDPGALVGTLDLTTPHLYLIRALIAETAGEGQAEYMARMKERFAEEFEAAIGTMPVDSDQDGALEEHEGVSMHTIELRRG